MFKIMAVISVLIISANAGVFDFVTLKKAKDAYEDNNYKEAINSYSKVANKSDEAKYDLANSYYKAKDYKKAKSYYNQIKKSSLQFNKWHNIGNCEANLGNIDAGIKAYEKALELKDDSDTRYNLRLLKKRKKEQNKKEKQNKSNKDQKSSKDQKDSSKKNQNKKDKNQDQKKSNKDQKKDQKSSNDQKDKKNQKSSSNQNKKGEDPKKSMGASKKEKEKNPNKPQTKAIGSALKKEPISDKEMAKYLKMLDKRGVNTLLVPLNSKGDRDEEIKPW
jgi:Ca-activated chloride channel family protein